MTSTHFFLLICSLTLYQTKFSNCLIISESLLCRKNVEAQIMLNRNIGHLLSMYNNWSHKANTRSTFTHKLIVLKEKICHEMFYV